jgi:F-type H+-transporting ATPase subunit a
MHGEGHGGGHGGLEHPGSWIHFLYTFHFLPEWIPEEAVIGILTAIALGVAAVLLTRRLTIIPSKTQAALELIVSGLQNFVTELIGPDGPKHLPIVGTAFLYILVMNFAGLFPGWKSATANINVTAALAITVFLYVQYQGLKANGFVGYLKHFVGEPIWLAPLNILVHVVGEFAKPLSLAIRLFGNLFGEDTVILVLMTMGIGLLPFLPKWVPIPIQVPMYFLGAFTALVQALVFSILTCVYIATVTAHHDHGGHEHDDHAETHGAAAHAAA